MKKYIYEGPVRSFDTCINPKWSGSTLAESEKKAKSNLAFQYKRQRGLAPSAKITLPGKIREVVLTEV